MRRHRRALEHVLPRVALRLPRLASARLLPTSAHLRLPPLASSIVASSFWPLKSFLPLASWQSRAGFLCHACPASTPPEDCAIPVTSSQGSLSTSVDAHAPAAAPQAAATTSGAPLEQDDSEQVADEGKKKPARDAEPMRCLHLCVGNQSSVMK